MPRDLDAGFLTNKNAETNDPIYLYTIHEYNGADSLYYTDREDDVTFDSITYTAFPIAHSSISQNVKGTIDKIRFTITNVDRQIGYYLENNDLRGKKVTVKQVFADDLADTNAYIDDVFYIDNYVATEEFVIFNCSTKFDILDVKIPMRLQTRNYCPFLFKGTECGYSGAGDSCGKTISACRAYSNVERFGGFPSIPSRKIYAG